MVGLKNIYIGDIHGRDTWKQKRYLIDENNKFKIGYLK